MRANRKYVRLPLRVLKFLLGVAPLEGVWFGQDHPKRKGRFWWRSAYLGKHYPRINAVDATPRRTDRSTDKGSS